MEKKQLYAVYELPVNEAKEMGYDLRQLKRYPVGSKMTTVVAVPTDDEELALKTRRYIWNKYKEQERDSRCIVPGDNGDFVRCHAECAECPYGKSSRDCMTVSSDAMFDEDQYEVPDETNPYDSVDTAELIEFCEKQLGDDELIAVFRGLKDGAAISDIADSLGMTRKQVRVRIEKVRGILRSVLKREDLCS